MNQQTSSHWLRLCSLGLSLCLASTSLAAPPDTSAADLYAQGVELFEASRIIEARDALIQIDLPSLDRAQRQDVLRMIDEIDAQLRAMPEPELRLRSAEICYQSQDYRGANGHLLAMLRHADTTPELKVAAHDLMAKVTADREALAPQIPTILSNAVDAFESGNYADAKAGFTCVFNSGVTLNLDEQKDLGRYLQQIATLEATHGRFEEGSIVSATVEDSKVQPVEEPPVEEPVEEPAQANEDEPPADDDAVAAEGEGEGEAEGEAEVEAEGEGEVEAEGEGEVGAVFVAPPDEEDTDNAGADLIDQAQQAKAEADFQQAQQALALGQFNLAEVLYRRVLAVQPDNQAAQDGLQRAMEMLHEGQILGDVNRDRQLQHDALIAEFANLMAQARLKLSEGSFEDAKNNATSARYRVDDGRSILTIDEFSALREEAANLYQEIADAGREAEIKRATDESEEMQIERLRQQQQLERQRAMQIANRLQQIRVLQRAQRYEEALLECDNLLFNDPGNYAGLALRDTIREVIAVRKYDQLVRDQNRRAVGNSINLMKETLIPNSVIEYPPDWPQISVRRSSEFAFNDSAADRQVWSALENQRLAVDFQGEPIGRVLDWVAKVAQVNVDVDWKALEDNFIDRNTPINLRLNDTVNLKVVLERTLGQLGTSEATRPHYDVQDGILTISTKERLEERPIMHIYPISDMLIDIPDFDNAPDFDIDKILSRNDANAQPFPARIFGENGEPKYERGRSRREELLQKIREVLTTSVDSPSWQINGGDTGVIMDLNSNLIITTTARNHRDISNLLGKLREIRSLQISVDSRFLVIDEEFFEQVGIDLDVYFGGSEFDTASKLDPNLLPIDLFTDPVTGNIGPVGRRQYTAGFDLVDTGTVDANGRPIFNQAVPASGIFNRTRNTFTPTAIQNDTIGLVKGLLGAPGGSIGDTILSAGPAFTWGVTFLNDLQLDLLIEATQADRRAVSLTSPKLTFFNGQRAFVQITTSQFFVSDLQPVVGTSSAGLDPTLAPVNEGVVLDVEGTVSADRRYVTMTVLASLADIIAIEETPVPVIVGGQVFDSSDPNNDIFTSTGSLESPVIQISRVNTTVNVPDQGTIMLGGQTIRNDIQVETGVPVLSKIPIINRFFTNRIDTVEEKTLMILLRPQIIIQQENEQLLYPGLEDTIRSGGGGFSTSY